MERASRNAAKYLAEYDKAEALDDDALRAATTSTAAEALALRLRRRGEISALKEWANHSGYGAREVLVRFLAETAQGEALRECVRAGYGPIARDSLGELYQTETEIPGPVTLDSAARLVP